MQSEALRIDVISDTVCPWCFVGKVRLERALDQWRGPPAHVSWRAFQLNPEMPDDGMDRADYLAAKFGGREQAAGVYEQINAAGAGEGIDFAFEAIGRTPNTIASHRLIHFAGQDGLQNAVVAALFAAYFLDGLDIGDDDVLCRLGATAGLGAAATAAMLAGDAGREAVVAEDTLARRMGINGVPCFIIEQKIALSGAQSPEILLDAFETALRQPDEAAEG